MLILAFDTTTEYGGAGIFRDSECLAAAAAAERVTSTANPEHTLDYSVILFQMVEALLVKAGRTLRDVDLFAVANGPGSFTGIRVGVAAAQAWGQAFEHPVLGVSVLEAMAEESGAETSWGLPVIDARRGEFFVAAFQASHPQPTPGRRNWKLAAADSRQEMTGGGQQEIVSKSQEGLILKPEALEDFVVTLGSSGTVTCLVREHDARAQALQKTLFERGSAPGAPPCGSALVSGASDRSGNAALPLRWKTLRGTLVSAIAVLALRACREGRLRSPAELDAFYVRRPDAEISWK